jgi:hypothetical protein
MTHSAMIVFLVVFGMSASSSRQSELVRVFLSGEVL